MAVINFDEFVKFFTIFLAVGGVCTLFSARIGVLVPWGVLKKTIDGWLWM